MTLISIGSYEIRELFMATTLPLWKEMMSAFCDGLSRKATLAD
jgi:hypothetical protein